jgi:hypothetical protein
MSTTPTPIPVLTSNPFERILGAIEMATAIASSIPSPISGFAHLADYFLKIAQAAVHAHESITGKPLDMSLLHQIDPVP